MPKYILLGLGVIIGLFLIISLWSKLDERIKNKLIADFVLAISIISSLILILIYNQEVNQFIYFQF